METTTQTKQIEAELFENGFVRSPNNVHGLPGSIWYPCAPGIPAPRYPVEILATAGKIILFRPELKGEPYTPSAHYEIITVQEFPTAADFITWTKTDCTPQPLSDRYY